LNARRALGLIPAAIGYGVGSFKRGISAGITGNWEGTERNRLRRRGQRDLSSQDARLNYGAREDLLSESRALAQTFPIARNINRKYANHVVGSCRIKWDTGDPAIDKIYADRWQAWMGIADLAGRHHFRKMTKIAVESILRDGRILGQKDQRGDFFQLAAIEGDRISSHGIYNLDTPGMVAGFKLDGNGRVQAARVWDRTIYGYFENPQEIPANQLVHAFDSDRFDAVTGVTAYHTVLNPIRDFKETGEAEQLAAKRNSKIALLWKTMMGGAPSAVVDLFANSDGTGNVASETGVNVQAVNDVADVYMFPNEEGKAFTSDRPSEGWRWLMEFQVRQIAMGLDLPFGVVWHMAGLGGPASRFEIGQANRVFCAFLEDIVGPMWIRPIVGAWVAFELSKGRLPFTANWYKFRIPAPASITIDLGRDSKAGIAENAAGLLSATEWFAEEDKDFETETERIAQEAAFRNTMARKYQVAPEELRLQTLNGNPGSAPSADGHEPPVTPLNGAQISAALEVMLKFREQSLSADAAVELMSQIGINRNRAATMVKNLPKLDSSEGDVSFMREILKSLLMVPAAREALYNSVDVQGLIASTGLPAEKGYKAPWIPVVAQPGPVVDGGTIKDGEGDVVGGTAKSDPVVKVPEKKPAVVPA
jgi:hypothetical protein